MKITSVGSFLLGTLEEVNYPEKDYERLAAMAPEDYTEELEEMLEEARCAAQPVVLFGVCTTGKQDEQVVYVNDVPVHSALAAEKLGGRNRCFPYIGTCGKSLEDWSGKYKGDPLAEYWADEIKKYFLGRVLVEFRTHLKECYHLGGHLTALNPGSINSWPISGQEDLFAVLGGREFVEEQIGVIYTDSYLMLPSKSVSGISFESEVFYENCQYCPLDKCLNRRAARIS